MPNQKMPFLRLHHDIIWCLLETIDIISYKITHLNVEKCVAWKPYEIEYKIEASVRVFKQFLPSPNAQNVQHV